MSHLGIFFHWIKLVIVSFVEKYILDNGIHMKALLVLDNAPINLSNIEEEMFEEFNFSNVLCHPTNITSSVQCMDHKAILIFRKFFSKHLYKVYFAY